MQPAQQIEQAPEADSPYNRVMKTWARWMQLDDKQHPSGCAHPQDVKEFMACAEAMDVLIDSLPRREWWAIRKAHGIATMWRYPQMSLADSLAAAELILLPKMQKNVSIRRYFT